MIRFMLVSLAFVFSTSAFAEHWGEEEKALWKVVKQSWVDDAEESGRWPDQYVHDRVLDWGSDWPKPRGKSSMGKWTNFRDKHSQMMEYELFPMAVVVEGDTGVAHYSVVSVRKNDEGEMERSMYGVVETLHRTDGKWLYLSLTGFEMGDDD